ncbi:MAG TPA: PmeII family type II restriction endonuclease [Candidatus Saccharimonadales bacterium]|nr:PmeII family type II restriction endonuclease [Candidatus Saccharimonadales bacterium]
MGKITENQIRNYIEQNIPAFHQRRLESLTGLKLKEVLKRKNPYLFRAKNITTAADLVKGILDAHLSSQEETIFGTFLEGLAIFICAKVYGGHKSAAEGIDLEVPKDGAIYIVTIKSGPNWGNSGQIARMVDNFKKAKRILATNTTGQKVVAINGCCYGREATQDKGDYLKLCGQNFWSFISGMENLYTDIIEPLGHTAKERNEEFDEEYGKRINSFTKQFIDEFCKSDGAILWDKFVRLTSSANGKY